MSQYSHFWHLPHRNRNITVFPLLTLTTYKQEYHSIPTSDTYHIQTGISQYSHFDTYHIEIGISQYSHFWHLPHTNRNITVFPLLTLTTYKQEYRSIPTSDTYHIQTVISQYSHFWHLPHTNRNIAIFPLLAFGRCIAPRTCWLSIRVPAIILLLPGMAVTVWNLTVPALAFHAVLCPWPHATVV